ARLKAADALLAGVGDAYVPSGSLEALVEALAEADLGQEPQEAVSAIIRRFAQDPGPAALAKHREKIAANFAGSTVEAFLAALEQYGSEWARTTAETMLTKSPTSMK